MSSKSGTVFVLNSLGIGGSETKIIRVANILARSGARIGIAYLNSPETALARIHPAVAITHLHRRGKYSYGSLKRLSRWIDGGSYDTVIAVNLYPLLYVIPAARRSYGKLRAIGLVNTAELTGKHALPGKLLYAPFLRLCDEVVFGCVAQRNLWANAYRLSEDRTRVVYNGVDHEHYAPDTSTTRGVALRQALGIPADAIVIGSVGRLAPEKSFDLLIEALATLNVGGRQCHLVLVGEGEGRYRLKQRADALNVADKVIFLGLQSDVRPALAMMDIFVLPSSAVETFSNAALEAMAMGRAVVLSDMGGAAEMVEQGKSGMLFRVGDVGTLTDILASLHDSSETRKALGEAARIRVVQLFRLDEMVLQYRALLNLGKPCGKRRMD